VNCHTSFVIVSLAIAMMRQAAFALPTTHVIRAFAQSAARKEHVMSTILERQNAKSALDRRASTTGTPVLIAIALVALAILGCAVAATWYPVGNLNDTYYVGP
jgi:hypothetical protein